MASAVSQLKYWREGDTGNNNGNEGNDGATYLSYNVFILLTLFGGFLALDHLYLRSPWTFVAKFAANFFLFGIWWIWDAAQAFFNEPVVRIYGLGIPGLGPKGIGAGVLAQDIPDKKHFRFFIYGIALIFGGMIGLDSFLVGQSELGIFRLLCTITFIFMPISIFEWVYHLYLFFTDTKGVVESHADYFGAKSGASRLTGWFYRFLQSFLGPVIVPITSTIDKGIAVYDKTLNTVNTTLKTGSEIIDGVGKIIDATSSASSVLPGTSLYSTITGPALEQTKAATSATGATDATSATSTTSTTSVTDATDTKTKNTTESAKVKGGNQEMNLNLLPYTLISTVLLVIITGFYKNYSKKNAQKDDAPPIPSSVSSTPSRSNESKRS
jgi:hypothetical protein